MKLSPNPILRAQQVDCIVHLLLRFYWRKRLYYRALRLGSRLLAIRVFCWLLGLGQRLVGYKP